MLISPVSLSCLTLLSHSPVSVSCLTPPVSRLLSPVCLMFHVLFTSPVIPRSPGSHLLSHVSSLMSHVSCLLSYVSFHMSPVTHLLFPAQCCRSGSGPRSVESVSFPWIQIWIRINNWLDPESGSGSVSNDTDPDPTKIIKNRK